MKQKLITILIFIFFGINGFAQTVDSIENVYHSCLDKGSDMLGCSTVFYSQMDSLLNVSYRRLMLTCNEIQKKNLKAEQKVWLIKRNSYFRKTLIKLKKETKGDSFVPQDNEIFRIDDNASFVKNRVVRLLKAINKDYSKSSK